MKPYLYVVSLAICVLLIPNTNSYTGDLVEPIDKPFVEHYMSDELDFLTLGDWGQEGVNQTNVAKAMEKWAGRYHSDFVINVGDNFYVSFAGDHEGVTGVDDPKWDRVWKGVYKGRLAEIPWYTVAGNHDWYGNVTAQIDYSLNYDSRFFLPSAFYVRESYFGPHKTKVAWIHIDTDLFYYDPLLIETKVDLKRHLEQVGWTSIQAIEAKLRWIEDRLIEQQDSKWIFVVGHHPLDALCAFQYYMWRLRPLFLRYRVAAYFAGHAHTLELETAKFGQPVTYFLSGAGSQTTFGCIGKDWGTDDRVIGFLHSTIKEDRMIYEFVDSTTLEPKEIYKGVIYPRRTVVAEKNGS